MKKAVASVIMSIIFILLSCKPTNKKGNSKIVNKDRTVKQGSKENPAQVSKCTKNKSLKHAKQGNKIADEDKVCKGKNKKRKTSKRKKNKRNKRRR